MRIPLKIVGGRFTTSAILSSHSMHVHGVITMIVDTGSTLSFISEGDAVRLHVPMKKLESKGVVEIGGCKSHYFALKKVTLSFKDEKGKIQKIELPEMYVLKSTKRDNKNLSIAYSIPSVIGVDFLQSQKFNLRTDITNNIVFLEKI